MNRDTRRPLQSLMHPVFLVALAALVLNDHVLKGAGLLPGMVTGKLSDLAGLVVAPVALSAAVGARTKGRRALAFGAVTLWFVAVNVSSVAAAWSMTAFGALGIGMRIWTDPTDLLALIALPVAWHVASTDRVRAARVWRERIVLGAAGLACIATSPIELPFAQLTIHNDTEETQTISIAHVSARMRCEQVRENPEAILGALDFGPETSFELPARTQMSFDRREAFAANELHPFQAPPSVHEGRCDAARVRVSGLPDTFVYWENFADRTYEPSVGEDDDKRAAAAAQGLVLTRVDEDTLRLAPPPGVTTFFEGSRPLVESFCPGPLGEAGFRWSGFDGMDGEPARIVGLDAEEPADGCFHFELEALGAEPRAVELCIPRDAFPFNDNAVVQVFASAQRLRIRRDLETDDGFLWRTGELAITRGVDGWVEGPFDLALAPVDDRCVGRRLDCGGIAAPAAALRRERTPRLVHPGQTAEADADDGRRAHLVVGRAELVVATTDDCVGGAATLGPALDALVWYGEAPR
ncbi:MAG: hypothetical protein AB7S26_22690 [Sandaracinaceae bacterium]